MGLPRSSQIVRPSQEQICLGFWKRPAERAMMPQANLWKDVWSAWAFSRPPQGSMCPTGTSMPPAGGGKTHLLPEFPVILDKGWFPRPRSSSPSSITRLRPITSHTFEGKQQSQLHCSSRRVPTFFPSYLQLFILYPEGGSAISLSQDVAQISPVLE